MSGTDEWIQTDLRPLISKLKESARELAEAESRARKCPTCGHVPQSWRNPQPRVPRSDVQPEPETGDQS